MKEDSFELLHEAASPEDHSSKSLTAYVPAYVHKNTLREAEAAPKALSKESSTSLFMKWLLDNIHF